VVVVPISAASGPMSQLPEKSLVEAKQTEARRQKTKSRMINRCFICGFFYHGTQQDGKAGNDRNISGT
jgi:hypothetical protein